MSDMSQMGQGKAPYNVAKRSLIRLIKKEQKLGMGDGFGQGFSCMNMADKELVTASASYIMGSQMEDALMYAFWKVENEILSAGGYLLGVRPVFIFPAKEEEALAAYWAKKLDLLCESCHCQILGMDARGSEKVDVPICMLTGYGMRTQKMCKVLPGWDIVAAGHIGMEGIVMLTRGKREELKKRFSFEFIEQAENFIKELSIKPMMEQVVQTKPVLSHAVGEGGILAGLWNLSERTGLGLCVRLKDIPVRQETVEISEFFSLNPYQMLSGGMALFVTPQGEELAGRLCRKNILARVIGKTTDKKERVVENGEERRFLDRPAVDELYKTGIFV